MQVNKEQNAANKTTVDANGLSDWLKPHTLEVEVNDIDYYLCNKEKKDEISSEEKLELEFLQDTEKVVLEKQKEEENIQQKNFPKHEEISEEKRLYGLREERKWALNPELFQPYTPTEYEHKRLRSLMGKAYNFVYGKIIDWRPVKDINNKILFNYVTIRQQNGIILEEIPANHIEGREPYLLEEIVIGNKRQHYATTYKDYLPDDAVLYRKNKFELFAKVYSNIDNEVNIEQQRQKSLYYTPNFAEIMELKKLMIGTRLDFSLGVFCFMVGKIKSITVERYRDTSDKTTTVINHITVILSDGRIKNGSVVSSNYSDDVHLNKDVVFVINAKNEIEYVITKHHDDEEWKRNY